MRSLSWSALFLFLSLPTLPALAQPLNLALFPRFTVTAGGYIGDFGTTMRLDPEITTRNGTDVDFEKDLGLDSSKSMTRFTAKWRPFERHEFGVNFFRAGRGATHNIDREIVFRDTTYPVHATIGTNMSIDYWDVTYTWWLHQAEQNGLGLNLGVSGMSISAALAVRASDATAVLNEDASTDLPVPVIGLEGRHAFTNRIIGMARVAALPKVTISDYSARAYVGNASVEYRLADAIAFGIGYNYFDVKGTIDKAHFNGALGITTQGFEGFIRLVVGVR